MMWKTIKLIDICTIKTGRKDVNEGNINGKYPFFTCAKEHTYSDEYSFDCEAILIAGNGAVGQTTYFNGKFEAYQRTYILSEFKGILQKLLLLILQEQLMNHLSVMVLGNTIPYIKKNMLENFELTIPPLEVQENILSRLNLIFAEIDKDLDKVIEAQKNINNIMQSIFDNIEKKNKGTLCENKIGELCNLMTGGTPNTKNKSYYNDGKIPWLVSGDVNKNVINDCEGRITELGFKKSNAKYLPINSVLIALNGQGKTRGTVALLKIKATCNQSLVSIYPKDKKKISAEYIFYYLKSKYDQIRKITGDSGNDRRGLNMPLIREIIIKYPKSYEQQEELVFKMKTLTENIMVMKEIYQSKINNLFKLKQSILKNSLIEKDLKTA